MRRTSQAWARNGPETWRTRTAVMCSEAVWWRCHRRLIADVMLMEHQIEVADLMPDGKQRPHEPSEGARIGEDGHVVGIKTERMELTGDGNVRGTGKFTTWGAQAVYRAVGYLPRGGRRRRGKVGPQPV